MFKKNGEKTMKKTLLLAAFSAVLFAFVSCASKKAGADESQGDSKARIEALAEEGAIDLATWQTADKFAMKYDAEAYTLTCNGGEYFQFPLPREINPGEYLTVHLTGTNNGDTGFRSWVVDNNQTTLTEELYLDFKKDGADYVTGDFDVTYTLDVTGPASFLFIKGPQWGTMIDNLTIKSVAVIYE